MKLSDLPSTELESRLTAGECYLELEPFVVRIRSTAPSVMYALTMMYGDFPLGVIGDFVDFHIEMLRVKGIRRWLRPQVNFYFDGIPSFQPLPLDHAYPMLEWGLNWCIASHAHQYLVIHSAVIEKYGRAVILPAPPGSGKSTLCAGLVSRGWRLLSDELTLLDIETGCIQPLARPINLKNQSIDVIRRFNPDAVLTAPVHDTKKGTVALMRPPVDSVRRVKELARPACVVFPKYEAGQPVSLAPFSKAHTCLRVAQESFNYDIHGLAGFEAITRLVDRCDCYEFSYGDLNEAVHEFDLLATTQ